MRSVHLLAAVLLIGGSLVRAGDWHAAATAVCSDCHTVHNSSSGLPMRYDGATIAAPKLLRAAGSEELCLHCHDGTLLGAPDVVDPVSYVVDPAGGHLLSPGQANPNGHDIGTAPIVPPGGSVAMTLTCTSCHDAHGTASYRNLLPDPPGAENLGDVIVSVDQQVLPNGFNADQVYVNSNLTDRQGFSAWCNDCHGDFHGRTAGEEGTDRPWLRHPQDETIVGAAGAAGAHWLGTISERVRVESPDDTLIPSADDRVFCLSCHKAHGSARPDALIYADGVAPLSTCQQCHDM